jgi:hypothetical protein
VAVSVAVGVGVGMGVFLTRRGYALPLDLVAVATAGGSAGIVWLQLEHGRPRAALLIMTLLGTIMNLATIHPYPIGAIVTAAMLGAGVFAAAMFERRRAARLATAALCVLLLGTKAQAVF